MSRKRAIVSCLFAFLLTAPASAHAVYWTSNGSASPGTPYVAASAGRYMPYPTRHERPARGPIRELVRTIVLAQRARRRVTEEQRRAFGG